MKSKGTKGQSKFWQREEFGIIAIVALVVIIVVVLLVKHLAGTKYEVYDTTPDSEDKQSIIYDIKDIYWSMIIDSRTKTNGRNVMTDDTYLVYYFSENGTGTLYVPYYDFFDTGGKKNESFGCFISHSFTYSISNNKITLQLNHSDEEYTSSISYFNNELFLNGSKYRRDKYGVFSDLHCDLNDSIENINIVLDKYSIDVFGTKLSTNPSVNSNSNNNASNNSSSQDKTNNQSNSGIKNNSGNQTNSNNNTSNSTTSNDPVQNDNQTTPSQPATQPFQASLRMWGEAKNNNPIGFIISTTSGSCSGCRYDVYINDRIVMENKYVSLKVGDDEYVQDGALVGYNLGSNELKVNIKKDGNIILTLTQPFTLDVSNVSVPNLNVNSSFNTYSSTQTLSIYADCNKCNDCQLAIYINGQRRTKSNYDVDLVIGRNEFTVEAVNRYGIKACKKVYITRYEYNPDVDSTKLGYWEVTDC